MVHVSDIKLIRTDTTLDLSQKLIFPFSVLLHCRCGTILGFINRVNILCQVKKCIVKSYSHKKKISNWNCRALPKREPFQKFSKAKAEPRPKRGFGNSFQPAIDAPRLLPH
ncbi:hypothetical protein ACOSQ3_020878 [Xanthoceras sorbifolium]